ncbi:unnamed protein product [Amoebophrya sp. A25]|nr:unnamed protein product [Amoebophrya sp. A25]|eukprot:GSA25T00012961001.1
MQVQAHHLDEEELPRGAICCWNPDNQSGCCGCDKSVEPSYLPRWCCAECVYPNYVGCNTFAIVLVVFTLIPFGALIPRIYVACIWKVPLWGIHYHRKMIAVVGPPMMVQQQPGMTRTTAAILRRNYSVRLTIF